jgi:factor associated with neutral sphingomyelinase activation
MKKALSVLHPHRYSSNNYFSSSCVKKRFSPLLLEHGEHELQDWGVFASSHIARSSNFESIEPLSTTSTSASTPTKSYTSKAKKEKEPSTHMKSVEGRLRLCSKSLVFEPNDISRAIIRIPFDKMTCTPKQDENSVQPSNTITFQSTRITVMMKNNIIAPYENIDRLVQFTFTFLHSSSENCLSLLEKIFSVSSLSELQDTIQPMFDQLFDSSNFHHVSEQPLTANLRAYVLTPLQKQVGCAIITNERFYFQPFNGVYAVVASKALSWDLTDIVATARRYHGLKDEALELFFEQGPSLLIAFEGYTNRELVMSFLPRTRNVEGASVEIVCHTDVGFLSKVVTLWRSGDIDNFYYILALNSASGRTFLDFSRYPVFPWVISDYTSDNLNLENTTEVFRDLSKPIGALNDERLQNFESRYNAMHKDMGDAFLYGTHYSAPGYCLYYLVRVLPEQMLCLQNGKYDSPDRLFFDISNCYSSILTNPADVKECIPQFYDTKSGMEMLMNIRGLQLGVTQNSIIIGDVKLPKWAKNPKDFIRKNRQALESDYCTTHLPSWIDLIFGFKSRGNVALKAMNLFHPTSYLTPKDLEKMDTEEEKLQAELQATEFGVCPDTLFIGQHPAKGDMVTNNESFLVIDNGRISQTNQVQSDVAKVASTPSRHAHKKLSKKSITSETLGHAVDNLNLNMESQPGVSEDDSVSETSKKEELHVTEEPTGSSDGNVRGSAVQLAKETLKKNMYAMSMSGSGESLHPSRTISQRGTFGSLDKDAPSIPSDSDIKVGDALMNNAQHGNWKLKKITSSEIHGGAVTACILSTGTESIIVTTSLDGGLMAHALPAVGEYDIEERHGFIPEHKTQKSTEEAKTRTFHNFRSHYSSDPLSCLALISDHSGGYIAFAGGHDDIVLAYGINSACGLASIYAHRDVVTGINLTPFPLGDGSSHVMLTSSWDATVKLWAVTIAENEHVKMTKEPMDEFYDAESQVECLDSMHHAENEMVIAAGCMDGLIVWKWIEMKAKTLIYKGKTNKSCSVVKWISTSRGEIFLLVAFDDGHISCYIMKNNELYPVSKRRIGSRVICATVASFMTSELFMGCEDGSLRLLTIGEDGHLDHEPIVFSSVNGIKSPKLTSISVLRANQDDKVYNVVTGAEDGSIALHVMEEQC